MKKRRKQNGIKYPIAYTLEGKKVYAYEIGLNPEIWKGVKFYVPGCEGSADDEMLFVSRKHRRGVTFFFRHKAKEVDDRKAPDKYLHNLSETILKERFDKSAETGEFWITYYVRGGCPHFDDCTLKDVVSCNKTPKPVKKKINLRDFYDSCILEKREDGFIADLLLTNSKDESQKPLFFEVLVTHECSDKKKQSGNKIIELTIKEPDDAENEIVQNNGPIIDEFLFLKPDNAPKIPPISFYGFEEVELPDKYPQYGNFALIKDGEKYSGSCQLIDCKDVDNRVKDKITLSISLPIDELKDVDLYELGMAISYKNVHHIKDCTLCKYYKIPFGSSDHLVDSRSCRLISSTYNYVDSKGNPNKMQQPYVCQLPWQCENFNKMTQASGCKDYIVDERRINELNNRINKFHCQITIY